MELLLVRGCTVWRVNKQWHLYSWQFYFSNASLAASFILVFTLEKRPKPEHNRCSLEHQDTYTNVCGPPHQYKIKQLSGKWRVFLSRKALIFTLIWHNRVHLVKKNSIHTGAQPSITIFPWRSYPWSGQAVQWTLNSNALRWICTSEQWKQSCFQSSRNDLLNSSPLSCMMVYFQCNSPEQLSKQKK